MRRTIFTAEHDLFRQTARAFFDKECAPHAQEWEETGSYDRDVWLKAGELGLIAWEVPEEFGGTGVYDFRYNAVVEEERVASGSVGIPFTLQNDLLAPYVVELTNQEQKRRWLPDYCAGRLLGAIGMTEPGTGSDLKAITTTAQRDGDAYVLNGAKTFITGGINADLVIVVAKTDPAAGHRGTSLLVVERGMEGFERGRKLDKVGLRAQDTAELFFHDVRVPVANLLGEEGQGFYYLMRNLPRERLSIAVTAVAVARRALDITLEYVTTRSAFGQKIGSFQANRFTLAELSVKVDVAQTYIDRCIEALNAEELTAEEAAGAKMWTTDLQGEVVDRCLQLFGGYGFMNEYEIARLWRDSRVQRIFGGTNEIMKEIVGRRLGL